MGPGAQVDIVVPCFTIAVLCRTLRRQEQTRPRPHASTLHHQGLAISPTSGLPPADQTSPLLPAKKMICTTSGTTPGNQACTRPMLA